MRDLNSPRLRAITGLVSMALGAGLVIWALPGYAGANAGQDSSPSTVELGDNATCGDLAPEGATWIELKVDPVEDGTFTDGTLTVTIDVRDTDDGPVFYWTSNIGVDAVFVKGGPGGLLYVYDPPAESTGDTGLHAPVNPQQRQVLRAEPRVVLLRQGPVDDLDDRGDDDLDHGDADDLDHRGADDDHDREADTTTTEAPTTTTEKPTTTTTEAPTTTDDREADHDHHRGADDLDDREADDDDHREADHDHHRGADNLDHREADDLDHRGDDDLDHAGVDDNHHRGVDHDHARVLNLDDVDRVLASGRASSHR